MSIARSTRVESPTEQRNPRTVDIDRLPAAEILRLLNDEDRGLADAVRVVIPELARVVDETTARLDSGGRLHYFGAGTSGRLALMDAAELIPTFGLPPGVVVAHHAGGPAAMTRPIEGTEDSSELGEADAAEVGPQDVVVGITASGRTPYVEGALRRARAVGAFTVLLTANPGALLADLVDVHLGVDTGPEAIAGSTRLKAASAHKLVLNSLSTAVMVALGRTYSNLMVDVAATNAKLRGRAVSILVEATGHDEAACVDALGAADGDLKTAMVGLLAGCGPQQAREALRDNGGRVRLAVAAARRP
ncbi:N-acetylmuramic acid 6-phosphate etherase [Hamadaea tsunoensis]|uniref:N-acetylmuramic acid 6-phosphate etherase n=1 Tax=Hamadaea tsunoensis TaxID=53368 RepID=UPI0005528FD7|nr:N-acetylmuramic acid 6-phosphate etherase [Hamadaea tsunoensis]